MTKKSEASGTQAYLYDADGRDREVDLESIAVGKLRPDDLLWIDVPDHDDASLDRVATLLGVDASIWTARDAGQAQLENYREYFRFTVNTAPGSENHAGRHRSQAGAPESENGVPGSVRLDFIVAERWLVTVHSGDVPCLQRFREQDKADTLIGLLSGQALAASLLDWHLGEYFHEVSRIEAAVDKLDERVLRESASRTLLGRMVALRRRVSKLRSLLVAQREVFYGLSRPDFTLVTDSGAAPFYESLVGRFERAVDEVERTRDVVVGSFELFTSRTSQQTNDLVKVLTFLTAIVGFCAAIAGLMGMNFKLAFFDTGLIGFAIVTGSLVFVALISVAYARFREWI
jgi:Mg2+ and Co2+ transporter CorA